MCSNYQIALGAVGLTPQGLKHLVVLDVAVDKKLMNRSGCFKNGGGDFMSNVVCGEIKLTRDSFSSCFIAAALSSAFYLRIQ